MCYMDFIVDALNVENTKKNVMPWAVSPVTLIWLFCQIKMKNALCQVITFEIASSGK